MLCRANEGHRLSVVHHESLEALANTFDLASETDPSGLGWEFGLARYTNETPDVWLPGETGGDAADNGNGTWTLTVRTPLLGDGEWAETGWWWLFRRPASPVAGEQPVTVVASVLVPAA